MDKISIEDILAAKPEAHPRIYTCAIGASKKAQIKKGASNGERN